MKIFNAIINLEEASLTQKNGKVYLQTDRKTHYLFPSIMNACAFADHGQGNEEQLTATLEAIGAPGLFDSYYELAYFIMLLDDYIDQSVKDEWAELKQAGYEYVTE